MSLVSPLGKGRDLHLNELDSPSPKDALRIFINLTYTSSVVYKHSDMQRCNHVPTGNIPFQNFYLGLISCELIWDEKSSGVCQLCYGEYSLLNSSIYNVRTLYFPCTFQNDPSITFTHSH